MRIRLPHDGERRTRTFFAVFPVWIADEMRLWEMVTVVEEYRILQFDKTGWKYVRFVDSDDQSGDE